jgi:hypothetical protein
MACSYVGSFVCQCFIATGKAANGVESAAEALGQQSERLRGQVDDFLSKIRSA